MSAGTMTGGRSLLRWRVMPVLISLMAWLGVPVHASQVALAVPRQAASISAGAHQSCVIEGGRAYCWGGNGDGELGDGSTADSGVPVAVDTSGVLAGNTLTQISSGWGFACAVDTLGAAYCWGDNDYGVLGDGSTVGYSDVPVAVDTSGVLAGKNLIQVAAGQDHVCALDAVGDVYCWGSNTLASSGMEHGGFPVFRWRWIPAARWPGRPSPRSRLARFTPVPWMPPGRRSAGAAAAAGSWVTDSTADSGVPVRWTLAARWPGRPLSR